MVYLLSKNFYNSPVSLNEIGAAWIKGFDFSDIYGVIDSKAIAIKLDDERLKIQTGLDDLKNDICTFLNISELVEWKQARDNCIDNMNKVKKDFERKPAIIMGSPI